MMTQTVISCSTISEWMSCELAAHSRLIDDKGDEKRKAPHVARWIGTCTHEKIAEAYGKGALEPFFPSPVRYDGITPTEKIARAQVDILVDVAVEQMRLRGFEEDIRDVLSEKRFAPITSPSWYGVHLEGTLDMAFVDANGELCILDIKTTSDVVPTWLQLGAYALLLEANSDQKVKWLYILHVPRDRIDVITKKIDMRKGHSHFYRMDAQEPMKMAKVAMQRIAQVASGHFPCTISPGRRCRSCPVTTCISNPRTERME